MVVIADDDPPVATRVAATARALAPTARILVRTRYRADADPLMAEGADLVIADELESVVQLFGEVLRNYEIPGDQIESYERIIRGRGYAALQESPAPAAFECEVDTDCLQTRRVHVRPGARLRERPRVRCKRARWRDSRCDTSNAPVRPWMRPMRCCSPETS
jgi:hypothetical protein